MPSDEDYADMSACRQRMIGRCTACGFEFYTKDALDRHLETEEHRRNIQKRE